MSFTQLSELPDELQALASHLARTAARLVEGLPNTRVYSEEQILRLIGVGPCSPRATLEILEQLAIVKKQYVETLERSGFNREDGWASGEKLIPDTRYVVVGTPMTLINHLKTAGDATPYFVSYYSGEGSDQAQNVHHALQTAGTPGFLSMTMTAGTTSRATMISALRNARTVLLIESPHYHSRPVCQVERDYSVARGARIIRVGTCPHSALVDCPPWIDDNLQYVNMQSARGFELQQLLSTPLPSPVELETRRRAAISLIEKTSAGDATLLATKLGIIDQLSGSGRVQKAELCQAMFLNPTQANRFCAEFDLDPLF